MSGLLRLYPPLWFVLTACAVVTFVAYVFGQWPSEAEAKRKQALGKAWEAVLVCEKDGVKVYRMQDGVHAYNYIYFTNKGNIAIR